MFLSRRNLILDYRVHGFRLSAEFRSRRVCGFSVWAFSVDVPDFVIVLFQSGVFEYILYCVRVVVATRVWFS